MAPNSSTSLFRKNLWPRKYPWTIYIILLSIIWISLVVYQLYVVQNAENLKHLSQESRLKQSLELHSEKIINKIAHGSDLNLGQLQRPAVDDNSEKIHALTTKPSNVVDFLSKDSKLNPKGIKIKKPSLILNQATTVKKSYVEFHWQNWHGPDTKRMSVVPGGRWDKPGLGEHGTAVKIDPKKLNPKDRKEFETDWGRNQFNEYLSKRISIQRDVPDRRYPECKKKFDHSDIDHLPAASIIICFYNEAWTVLQRTVYSILLRTPPKLVKEIILVDDFSNLDNLKQPLEMFVAKIDKLRLLRMTERLGLVQARLAGTNVAHGPILVFLDSHVECLEGWLQPLLKDLVQNPRVAIAPTIDIVDENTFEIQTVPANLGVLEFEYFSFGWLYLFPRIRKMMKSAADSFQSPTMAGGLFAIRKDYFLHLGTYDPNFRLWGGENIELSLKLWLCGGGILIHPCSRVAHIFRKNNPHIYNDHMLSLVNYNMLRVAYVWTQDYFDLFFRNKNISSEDWKIFTKDIEEQIKLRNKLGCKKFSWFVDNIFPELYVKGVGKYIGPIRASQTALCIGGKKGKENPGPLVLVDCDGAAMTWELTRIQEIRNGHNCITSVGGNHTTATRPCDGFRINQVFEYNDQNKTIYHKATKRCLAVRPDNHDVVLLPCLKSSPHQKWLWELNPR